MITLYIDLFCGAGGTSTGVENARIDGRKCAKVIACVNHDANAIASHAANHPDARTRLPAAQAEPDTQETAINPSAEKNETTEKLSPQ